MVGRMFRDHRPKTVRAKRTPRAKTRPKTVHIIELEIDGIWVPHVSDGNDGYVPCDEKGEPLSESSHLLGQGDSSMGGLEAGSGNAEASSSSHPPPGGATSPTSSASASAERRPKRTRASLGRAVVASMLDDSDGGPSTSTPSGRGKKRAGPGTEDREWSQTPKSGKKGKPGPKPKSKGGVLAHLSPEERQYFIDLAAGLDQLRDAVPALRAL